MGDRFTPRWKRAVLALPGARAALRRRRERRFRATFTACRGVYASFEEARRAIPEDSRAGFDVAGAEDLYRYRLDVVAPHDYPVMFWLGRLLAPGARVLDLGGSIGVHYFAYRTRLAYPDGLVWTVAEVPRVAAAGEALARERGAAQLRFAHGWAGHGPADVVLSAGALQYIEEPLDAVLPALGALPGHVLVNKVPLTDGAGFVTLQNHGVSLSPARVANRRLFVGSLEALGYTLEDSWDVPGYPGCQILDHPERSVPTLSGLYLRHRDAPALPAAASPSDG
jgi:putative methyltransferase (TIGR04325 family)